MVIHILNLVAGLVGMVIALGIVFALYELFNHKE